jgi:prepilin-type N-terminal cleavage/methylation domain-containing protein
MKGYLIHVKGRDVMNTRRSYKVKGFSLVEMIVVIAIISVLAAIIVPALTGWVKKARIAVAISDARLIKTTVENSLVNEFEYNQGNIPNPDVAFNKVIYLSSDKKRI